MKKYIQNFAVSFQKFIEQSGRSLDAVITLTNHNHSWSLAYRSKAAGEYKEEFATLLFLKPCPFYPQLQSLLDYMDTQYELENFQLQIQVSKNPAHIWFRMDEIQDLIHQWERTE